MDFVSKTLFLIAFWSGFAYSAFPGFSTTGKIEKVVAAFNNAQLEQAFLLEYPVCSALAEDDAILSGVYSTRARVLVGPVGKNNNGYFVDVVIDDVTLIDQPTSVVRSEYLQAFTHESTDIPELPAINLQESGIKNVAQLLVTATYKSIADRIKKSLFHSLGMKEERQLVLKVNGNPLQDHIEINSPLCSGRVVKYQEVSRELGQSYARGMLPTRRSWNAAQEKVFMLDDDGNQIAFAYKSRLPVEAVALLETNDEFRLRQASSRIAKGAKIVGGSKVPSDENTDWLVAIARKRPNNTYAQFCAGTLISSNLVVTAAHCDIDNSHYAIVGRKAINGGGGRAIRITQMWRHMDYSREARFDSDIAVLKLEEHVDAVLGREFVVQILEKPLPQIADIRVMGWGATYFKGQVSEDLAYVDLRVLQRANCRYRFKGSQLNFTDNMLCAASMGKDACQGDSGGGAYYQSHEDNRLYLAGIVSSGIGCADSRYPGVYTNVTAFKDWIGLVTRRLNTME